MHTPLFLRLRAFLLLGVSVSLTLACGKDPGQSSRPAPTTQQASPFERDSSQESLELPVTRVAQRERRGDPLEVSQAQETLGIPHLRFQVALGDSPARGPRDAPVTIVMFSDFECPYCAQAIKTIESIESEYPGKIQLVYKIFPIDHDSDAISAALVAHAAQEQGKFWDFHARLYQKHELTPELVLLYAQQAGLDEQRVMQEMKEFTHASDLLRDLRQGKALDVYSTPVFFINGRHLRGAKPIEAFRMIVDQELALVQRETSHGVLPKHIYRHLTSRGYSEVAYPSDPHGLIEGKLYPIPIGNSPQLGPKDALITMVVFADFQCPYCVRGHETMGRLRALYGEQLRIVYRSLPLPGHPMGAVAAKAALYAHQHGQFESFQAQVYDHDARFELSDLQEIGQKLGFDADDFLSAMMGDQYKDPIAHDLQLGRQLGVRGTPAYFINGRALVGARPIFDFRLLIEDELKKARTLLETGVPADKIYSTIVGL